MPSAVTQIAKNTSAKAPRLYTKTHTLPTLAITNETQADDTKFTSMSDCLREEIKSICKIE